MASDFDKQLKGIFNTVRSTINPDYAIPKEKAHEPMNVRIQRMKEATEQINSKMKELSTALSAFTTNLNALTEEVQPYLSKESEGGVSAAPVADKPAAEAPAAEAPAAEAPAADAPAADAGDKTDTTTENK